MTKDEIRAILGDVIAEDGSIDAYTKDGFGCIEFNAGKRHAWLSQLFTAEELLAIAAHMRAHTPPIDTAPAQAQNTTSS